MYLDRHQTNFIHKLNYAKSNTSKGKGMRGSNVGMKQIPSDDHVLEKSALLRNMTAQCRHTLLVNVKERTVEDGGFLCKQGEVGTAMLIIKTGEVRLFREQNEPVPGQGAAEEAAPAAHSRKVLERPKHPTMTAQSMRQNSTIGAVPCPVEPVPPAAQSSRCRPKTKKRGSLVEVPEPAQRKAQIHRRGSRVRNSDNSTVAVLATTKISGYQEYVRELGVGDTIGESHLMAMFAPGGERDDDDDDDQATTARRRRASMIRRGIGETTVEHEQDQAKPKPDIAGRERKSSLNVCGINYVCETSVTTGVPEPPAPKAGIGKEQVLGYTPSSYTVVLRYTHLSYTSTRIHPLIVYSIHSLIVYSILCTTSSRSVHLIAPANLMCAPGYGVPSHIISHHLTSSHGISYHLYHLTSSHV
jgi:CRP-like cAMP-binding protein